MQTENHKCRACAKRGLAYDPQMVRVVCGAPQSHGRMLVRGEGVTGREGTGGDGDDRSSSGDGDVMVKELMSFCDCFFLFFLAFVVMVVMVMSLSFCDGDDG